jgi:hypothetical protein
MSDFTITVIYDPSKTPKFHYVDEAGVDNETKSGCHGGKTIQWKLDNNGKASDLKIQFPSLDNPFDPPVTALSPNTPYKFNCDHKTLLKYSVTVKDSKGKIVLDDPHIMFDDGHGTTGGDDFTLRLLDDSLAKLGTAAQSAFQGLITDMQTTHAVNRNPNGLFFPGGITSIQVSVTAPLGITVNLTISGADPTALFPPQAGRE